MIRPRHQMFFSFLVVVTLLLGSVIGFLSVVSAAGPKDYPDKAVTFIAQSKPGSGLDLTIRSINNTLIKEGLAPENVAIPVINMTGSSQAILNIVTRHKNDPYMISVSSVGSTMNYVTGVLPYSHKDITPIAKLISAYYGVFVKYDSPYKTLGELIRDLKSDPGGTPLSGGKFDDRFFYGALFSKAGIDITKINYAAFDGGTLASTVVLEGTAKAMVTTVDDIMPLIESKMLRPLAVSSPERIGGLFKDYPTVKEAGVDLVWENFRYVIGPPGFPDYAKKYWTEVLRKMVKTPTWQDLVKKYRWGDAFMAEGFDEFLDEKLVVIKKVATELGMTKK